jgi:hypothetical protein
MLSGVVRLIANHRSLASSKAHQKSGPFAPPALPDLDARTTLSVNRPVRRLTRRRRRELRPVRASPDYPQHLDQRAVPTPPGGSRRVHVSIASPSHAAFPVIRAGRHPRHHFRACSGFTRVTAHWLARPPKAAFVSRLRPVQLPERAACQLPDRQLSGWNLPPLVLRAVGAHRIEWANSRITSGHRRCLAWDMAKTQVVGVRPFRANALQPSPRGLYAFTSA